MDKQRNTAAFTGITFEVTTVEIAKDNLFEVDYQEAVRTTIAVKDMRPAELKSYSQSRSKLLRDVHCNPFIAALSWAYRDHRPLCFSPDMIWLLIEQGAASHINARGEDLRHVLVSHEGKKIIKVQGSNISSGQPDINWSAAIEEISSKLRDSMTVEARNLFLANFSTTGLVEKTAFQIALFDALQRFFEITLISAICGIPRITLEGTVSDWERLADRFEALAILDLDWWMLPMRPILRQFVEASKGKPDIHFWRSIYREYQGIPCLRPNTALGWVYAFFPYLNHRESDLTRNPWLFGRQLDRLMSPPEPTKPIRGRGDMKTFRDEAIEGISDGVLPVGLSFAPFIWQEKLTLTGPPLATHNMEFLAGFVGVAQDLQTQTLRPEIGWAIREAPSV